MKTIRRPISILLAVLMVVGMFTVLPITASAAPPESGSSGSMETGTTITPSAAKWTFKLNSNFSGEWNADTDVVSEQPVELNLAAGDYEFQIIANDGTTTFYRGNEQAGSSTETYSQVMHDNGGNAKFHADGGKYTLTYNSGSGVLTIKPVYVAEIDGTNYKTLDAAIAAAQAGDTVKLLSDIDVTERIVINKDITITGEGYTLKTTNAAADCMFIFGSKDHKLTISNTVLDGNNLSENAIWTQASGGGSTQSAEVTLTDVTVQNFKGYTYVGAVYLFSNAVGNFNNCVFSNNATPSDSDDGLSGKDIWAGAKATVNINKGTIGDVYLHGGSASVTIDGNATVDTVKYGYTKAGEDSTQMKATVVSGTVNNVALGTGIQLAEENFVAASTADLTNAPAGYKWVDSAETGKKTLAPIPYVAKIGDTGYATLEEAFAAAQDGDTITVLADSAGNGIKVLKNTFKTKGLTVDFADHTYTVSGTPVGSTGTESIGFQLLKGNKITFQNGTITGNSNENTDLQRMIQNYSDLTLYNMTVSMVGRYNNQITVSTCNGKTVINNSTISAPDFTWAGYDDPADVGAAALAVGTFSSYPSIDVTVEGDSTTINGDVNVSDDNNKKAFSLKLNGGKLNGKINLDENAKAAIDDTESTANVTKADSFTQKAPEGYKWVDNGDGTSTLAVANYVAQVGETKYESLEEAVAAAPAGATVTLLADIDYSEIYTVRNARDTGDAHSIDLKDLTLDLNDNTISAINGTVTFGGNGATIKNGTFALVPKNTDGSYKDGSYALFVDNVPLGYPTTATVNIEDVVCEGAVNLSGVTAELTDVTASTTPTKFYTVWAENGANVTINSGTYTDAQPKGKGNLGVGASDTESVIYVKGGNFNATVRNVYSKTPAGSVQISGGTFTKPVLDEYCAEGFVPKDNGDGTYTVGGPYAAIIGDTGYATLEAAFAAAVDGDTIKVLANCSGNGVVVPQGKFASGLTVDFGGKTYTVDGETVGSSGTETNGFQLLKGNNITFKGGTITSTKAKILVQNYSNLTLDGMKLTLDNQNYTSAYTLSNNNGNTVIKDTTINANPAGGFAFDVCRFKKGNTYKSVHVTVTGESKINGNVEISASNNDPKDGFSLNLNGGTMSGKIIVDPSAAAAMESAPNKASVNKKNTFEQDPAAGYKWKAIDENTSTLVKVPKLFTGHNITLRGDVSLNFFIDTKAIENYDPSVPAKVVFTYDGTRTAEVDFADATPASDGVIVATIQVPAAFMAHQIKAVVYYDGAAQAETDEYSIQQYAETLIADPAAYGIPAAKVDAVKTLMKEMLNYGAKAQTVFAGQVKEQAAYDDLTEKYDYHMAPVTADMIQAAIDAAPQNTGKTATDLSTVKPEANATFYTASVVFLSESTLKIVFKVPGGSTITGYDGSQKNTYYWVQETDIAAAQLDTLQEFTVGDATFYYSALDYAKVVLKNGNAAAQDLVSALYLYNQAANGYFGANA